MIKVHYVNVCKFQNETPHFVQVTPHLDVYPMEAQADLPMRHTQDYS
jgi:hypothetical protein